MGRDFSQNKFDGTLGEELDRLWAAIKQDQILSSPSVQATRTPSGTTLNGAPKKAGGAVTMPIEENLSGQCWAIDGDQPMDSFPNVVNVKSPDGSRAMRVLGYPLQSHHMTTSNRGAPPAPPQFQGLANLVWPVRTNLIEFPSTYPVFEWPNVSTTYPVQYQGSTYNMFWLFLDGARSDSWEPMPGGYRASIYPNGASACLQKLAVPFTDQAGRIDYYLNSVVSTHSGIPFLHWWKIASIT